jgi:cytochrome c oxidase subunit III
MSEVRFDVDASTLPKSAFGPKELVWWGTTGFIVAEGTMFAVAVAAYFYLSRNFEAWPPPGTAAPELLAPTITLVLLLASIWIARRIDQSAKGHDVAATRRWLVVASIAALIILAARAVEFDSLNTRWDSNAYGSAVWVIIGFHTTHMIMDAVESMVQAAMFLTGSVEQKHLVDASEGAYYWIFVALSWVPLYAVIYWAPRVMG